MPNPLKPVMLDPDTFLVFMVTDKAYLMSVVDKKYGRDFAVKHANRLTRHSGNWHHVTTLRDAANFTAAQKGMSEPTPEEMNAMLWNDVSDLKERTTF